MNTNDTLAAGRLMAVERFRYFRAAILGMVFKAVPGLGTFATTKRGVMLWDPACAEEWTVEQISTVIVHEVGHLLRKHADRCERLHADPALFNLAADAEINDDLTAAKLKFPGEPVVPSTLGAPDGLTAEEYYRAAEQQAKTSKEGDGEEDDSDAQGKGAADGTTSANGKAGRGVGSGRCGGCAGHPEPHEPDAAGSAGRSDVDLERIRRTVADAIRAETAKGRGTVPGGWATWADEMLSPPKIPWRQKLAKLIRGCVAYRPGVVDLHWNRPSRRQAGLGFGPGRPVLPAYRAPVPRVAVVVDTSGSMGQTELTAALAEVRGVLAATGSTVEFCACDAAVHELRTVARWQDVAKLMKGGGGTDMRPAIVALEARKPKPDVVIIATDGQIGDAGPQPGFKVIWVVVGKYRNAKPAAWGEIVEISEDETRGNRAA